MTPKKLRWEATLTGRQVAELMASIPTIQARTGGFERVRLGFFGSEERPTTAPAWRLKSRSAKGEREETYLLTDGRQMIYSNFVETSSVRHSTSFKSPDKPVDQVALQMGLTNAFPILQEIFPVR